ncbi:MAG: hypothetical protein LWW77_07300, partial [Propionibacteriales bacterium]|nr:hypothetical protein [Propionibacteriales bacterium]
MDAVAHRARGRALGVGAVLMVTAALVLSGCAKPDPTTLGTSPSPQSNASTPAPSPTPTVTPTQTAPTDPFETLSAETKKEFKGCLTKVVGPGSSGKCAALVIKKLKAAGFYPWAKTSSINVTGANAILNYQR